MSDRSPRVGVACLVASGPHRLVLGKRGRGPNIGKWVLPGGGIEFLETWEDTATREVLEETGLTVRPVALYPVVMQIIGRDSHRICLVARVHLVGPISDLRPSDELPEVRVFDTDELMGLESLSFPVRKCLSDLDIIP